MIEDPFLYKCVVWLNVRGGNWLCEEYKFDWNLGFFVFVEMNISELEREFKLKVDDKIIVRYDGVGRYRIIYKPFIGDHFVIILEKRNKNRWYFTDENSKHCREILGNRYGDTLLSFIDWKNRGWE
jgi:hypothetical protein